MHISVYMYVFVEVSIHFTKTFCV